MGLVAFVLVAATALAPALGPAEPGERSWIDRQQLYESWLGSAEVVDLEKVGEGVTNPTKVKLRYGDNVFYAIYKPLKRGRQRGFWESYQAEVAAYRLDKLMGLGMVPPTVVRRINGSLGSLQLWVEGCDSYKRLESRVPQTPAFSQQVSKMKMFDNLIFNEDRNSGNFLLDESWNVILIDHSRAFLDRKGLIKDASKLPAQYDRKLVERLRGLSRAELETTFDGLLLGGQIQSILQRRDELLKHLQDLVAARGEASVLFE